MRRSAPPRSGASARSASDDGAFGVRVARFEAAAESLGALAEALRAHSTAAAAQRSAAAGVAERLLSFSTRPQQDHHAHHIHQLAPQQQQQHQQQQQDGHPIGSGSSNSAGGIGGTGASGPANSLSYSSTTGRERQNSAASSAVFQAVVTAVHTAGEASSKAQARFMTEVDAPVQRLVEELPKVRDAIKRRNAEAAAATKWEKKVDTARLSTSGKNSKRAADYDRRLQETVVRFEMAHNEAVNRMDNIDRNLTTFLHPPLVAFLAITADAMGEQKHAFSSASGGLGPGGVSGLRAAQISRDDNFQTQRERRKRSKDGSTGQQIEVWDDADFDESEVGSTTPRLLAATGGLIPTIDERSGEGSSSAVLDRNMADATVKMRISNTSSVSADAFDGPGGGQDDGSLSGHSFIRHLSKHSMPATPTSTASSSGSKREFTRTPDDAPERGDRNDVLLRLCALFPFTAQETNEISLAAGDVIDVTSSDESGWWLGRVNGISGYFPRTYCRALTQEEELDQLGKQSSRNLLFVSDSAGAVSRNCPMPRVSSGKSAGSTGHSHHHRLGSFKVRND